MVKFLIKKSAWGKLSCCLASILLLNSCVFGPYRYGQLALPTSQRPWNSQATDLSFYPRNDSALFELPPYAGYPDNQVLGLHKMEGANQYRHAPLELPRTTISPTKDTLASPSYTPRHLPAGLDKVYFNTSTHASFEAPGTVWVEDAGILVDETELPNIEWQVFLNYVARDSGRVVAAHYLPQEASLPLPNYFTDPFYRYFPVVGISRGQVEAYCRWRSAVTTEALSNIRQFGPTHPSYMVMHYRLPTEAEWEYAAGSDISPTEPYGVPQAQNRFHIRPKAAAYLRTRARATQSVAQIKQDILAFNKAAPELIQFNCQRQAPYFLALPTPGYVYDLPQNFFGLYQMNGNAAEMVQEPNLTKGGSYRDPLAACAIKARGTYIGPTPTIGFRCVCELLFPNQR